MKSLGLGARLTLLNIAVMVVVLIPLGVISYQRESGEMNHLLDGRLAQAGRTLGNLIEHSEEMTARSPGAPSTLGADVAPAVVVAVRRRNYEPEVGFQAYDRHGTPIAATENLADLPAPTDADVGFRDLRHEDHAWRLFTLRNRAGLLIRIGERSDNRQDIARGLVLEHSLPLLIGLPLLAVLIGLAVRQGLRPLRALTSQLDERMPGSRQPVEMAEPAPELRPLVETLNQQFERLENALERERRFNADVAHELRTPLTATMIHLESAMIAGGASMATGSALSSAQQSLQRLARRIEQVLALARIEAGAAASERENVDLVALTKDVIEELAPLIVEKGVAMSLAASETDMQLAAYEAAMTAMLRNVIENALRYAPAGGKVDIDLTAGPDVVVIDIRDNGPGIPPERRAAVFDRFLRGTNEPSSGFGLGLSIVKRAAELHDARVDLREPGEGTGLHVHIRLPRRPSASSMTWPKG